MTQAATTISGMSTRVLAKITQGIRREWGTRLGPYPSAEAASHWRDSIARHNAEADAEDMRDQQ